MVRPPKVPMIVSFGSLYLHLKALLLLLSLLKKIGNARPGEGDGHPISPKTPTPPYQPIEEKKRKGKKLKTKKSATRLTKRHWTCF